MPQLQHLFCGFFGNVLPDSRLVKILPKADSCTAFSTMLVMSLVLQSMVNDPLPIGPTVA